MGIVKMTENITLNIYWKKWIKPEQRNDYIKITGDIAKKIDSSATFSSHKDGCTFIKIELPHLEMESYHNVNDDECRYDYQKVEQLLEELGSNDDVSSVHLELNDLEKGGVNFYIDHPHYKVISYKEGFAHIIQLYPL